MKAITINNEVKDLETFSTFVFKNKTYSNLQNIPEATLYQWGFREVVTPVLQENKKLKTPLLPEDFDFDSDTYIFKIIDIPPLTPLQLAQQALEQIKQFNQQKAADGLYYFLNIEAEITLSYLGKPAIDVNPIIAEVDAIIYPLLDLVKNGQWYSAMLTISNNVTVPQLTEPLALFIKISEEITEYVTLNYNN